MNYHLLAVKQAIVEHGESFVFHRTTAGVYDIETGSSANIETDYVFRAYKKQVVANQYNHPNLIGKEVNVFYVAADEIPFAPTMRDHITSRGVRHQVDSITEHVAHSIVVMYKVLTVKG